MSACERCGAAAERLIAALHPDGGRIMACPACAAAVAAGEPVVLPCTCELRAEGTRWENRVPAADCRRHPGQLDVVPVPAPTFESVTAALASWSAPVWATSTRVEDGGLWHSRDGGACTALGDQDEPMDVTPQLTQMDAAVIDQGGSIRIVREGEPVVLLEGLRLSLDQADTLGRALIALAEQGQR